MERTDILLTELPLTVQNSINEIVRKQSLNTFHIQINKVSTGGNNFLGELYEIDLVGQSDESHKDLNIFIKHIIKNDDFVIYSIPEVYAKEAFVYLELTRIFIDLQNEAKVPKEKQLNVAKSFEETNSECIILENLAKRGYKTMPRMEIMTEEFARQSVIQLARFHALSFVLQKKNPIYYETKIKTIKQSMKYDEYWNDLIKKVYVTSVLKLDKARKHKVEKFFLSSFDKYPKYMNGLNSSLKCLCHGDYKMNNILYKEEAGHITDLIPIDFQQIYYGCPVIDLIYFIYAASDREFRVNNMHHLKNLYYESLTSFLKYFDIDFNSICSKHDFDQTFMDSLDYAPMYTLYMLPFFYVVDELPSGNDDLMELTLKVDDRFYDRITEIVDEFIDMNII